MLEGSTTDCVDNDASVFTRTLSVAISEELGHVLVLYRALIHHLCWNELAVDCRLGNVHDLRFIKQDFSVSTFLLENASKMRAIHAAVHKFALFPKIPCENLSKNRLVELRIALNEALIHH